MMKQDENRISNGMRPHRRRIGGWICGLAFLGALVCGAPLPAQDRPGAGDRSGDASAADASPQKSVRDLEFNFHDVDITAFIEFISKLTKKNFVLDNRVKGRVNIISPGRISVEEAYRVFETVLDVHGFAAVESGEIIKIIPSPDARTQNIETRLKEDALTPEDRVVTQLIPLKYADAEEIRRLFAPLVSRSSVILAYQQTNMLILTDVYSNILRLMKILETIDVTGIGREITIIPVEFADAERMSSLIESVFREDARAAGARKDATERLMRFVADTRTNSIILFASEADTERVRTLIGALDREIPRGKERIHVYYLENAKAEEIASVLQAIPSSQPAGGGEAGGRKEAPLVSRNVTITPDKATNSLLIMAEKDEYLIIEEVIQQLDIRRSMVFIECLIMEVNVDKGFHLGTEWSVMGEGSHDGRAGAAGGGFGGTGQYDNIRGMITPNVLGIGSLPAGFSMGVFGEPIQVGAVAFPTIAALIQAYKKDKDVHILSTPQILTTDNQEAKIHVGKNIPYLTRIGTTSIAETYSNYEYKDVGITLTITPQISKDRRVRLDISQEIQKLDQLATIGADRPSTLKRTVETTVIVNDRQTVVIGGLIDDSLSSTEYRVPCLGGIPLIGWLFKSVNRSREKTNLFVFLTPRVIREDEEAEDVYREKKAELDRVRETTIRMYGGVGGASAPENIPHGEVPATPGEE